MLTEASSDARELMTFADSDEDLYHRSHKPIINNLAKKAKKGVYNPEKAKILWKHHADKTVQAYVKRHGFPGDENKWNKWFTTSTRKEAAEHWEKNIEMKYTANNGYRFG